MATKIKIIRQGSPRRITLGDLAVGDTFRFSAQQRDENIYLVIWSDEPDIVKYISLSTGSFHKNHSTKEVVPVSCILTYKDAVEE